jgi:hypothetical protein
MQYNPNSKGYIGNQEVVLSGSFRIDGTDDPDVIRDGNTNMVESVERDSAGLFIVTLASGFPIPERLRSWKISMARAAVPTQEISECFLVVDEYDHVERTFQIACVDGVDGSNAAVDPDDNDMIAWELVGSISSVGTDAA